MNNCIFCNNDTSFFAHHEQCCLACGDNLQNLMKEGKLIPWIIAVLNKSKEYQDAIDKLSELDNKVQLHQTIEIHYYVDHYAAQYYSTDGQRLVDTGEGESILDALINLAPKIKDIGS